MKDVYGLLTGDLVTVTSPKPLITSNTLVNLDMPAKFEQNKYREITGVYLYTAVVDKIAYVILFVDELICVSLWNGHERTVEKVK